MTGNPAAAAIVAELVRLGGASYKRILLEHGVHEPVHGVKIADIRRIQRRLGGTDHQLALEEREVLSGEALTRRSATRRASPTTRC